MSLQPMYPGQPNSPQTELAADITATDTTIPVLNAAALPPAPNLAVIGSDESAETVLYTGIEGNNLTGVTRGFQGVAKAWNAGTKVARNFTAYDYDALRQNVEEVAGEVATVQGDVSAIQSDISDIRADIGDMSTVPTTAKNAAGAISELFQSVSDGKTLIAGAITDKGVPTSPSDTFATMAANIGAIETGLDSFFGDGSDGDFNSTGNVTFPVTAHSGLVVKQYRSFRLNAGHTMTVNNPCRGFVIYVQEDCIIDGIIDMSQKAGLAPNGEPPLMVITKNVDKYYRLNTVLQSLKGGAGGNGGFGGGGSGGINRQSQVGTGGSGRQNLGGFGGGGAGGGGDRQGGQGGSIILAELGGGQGTNPPYSSTSVILYGVSGSNGSGGTGAVSSANNAGAGGKCNGGGGGGSGQASYPSSSSSNGQDGGYAGGFVCLIVGGNITITGTIKANGGSGGAGSPATGNAGGGGGGGGGGAGGGVIAIFHRGTYTNNGTLQANGGSGGQGGAGVSGGETGGSGTSGSVGTIHVEQIA